MANDDREWILEQATGVRDCEGRMIFENDVLEIGMQTWGVVKYDRQYAMFIVVLQSKHHVPLVSYLIMPVKLEVMGNIHQI